MMAGKCTAEEIKELMAYESEHDGETPVWDEAAMGNKQTLERQIFEGLEQRMNAGAGQAHSRSRTLSIVWKAAAAVSIIGLSSYFIALNYRTPPPAIAVAPAPANDVEPGSNKAILTLSNGAQVVLNDAGKGVIAQQGNTKLTKQDDGTLAYTTGAAAHEAPIGYNTVATPRGGQYQITLPDGSGVWLNASSSIRFPTRFAGAERRVEVTGEIYFEVQKNASMPFRVIAYGQEIEVLGTTFNVMAYEDEPYIKTTLVEGSVHITNPHGSALLKPGEQCIYNIRKETIHITDADVDEALAWKTGQFIFNNEDLHSIMRKVARWYNIDVRYDENVKNARFTGGISRFENVSDILKMLELTGTVHFKIEERRVDVMP